jgi:hypothetical protein
VYDQVSKDIYIIDMDIFTLSNLRPLFHHSIIHIFIDFDPFASLSASSSSTSFPCLLFATVFQQAPGLNVGKHWCLESIEMYPRRITQ